MELCVGFDFYRIVCHKELPDCSFLWCYYRQRAECWEHNFRVYYCQVKTVEYFKLFECYAIEVTAFQISVSEWRSVSTHVSSGLSKMTHISHLMTPLSRMKVTLCFLFAGFKFCCKLAVCVNWMWSVDNWVACCHSPSPRRLCLGELGFAFSDAVRECQHLARNYFPRY